ncbi:DUF1059 domain-containing protein [Flavicella marina]|uniref:DUF1059 domain-containing protein n=1 Tax=Flavicella marina TaxID=1475951 RepID=UPI001D020B0F|nr:DUF1059 domain-containing protein [Flavicella marina]
MAEAIENKLNRIFDSNSKIIIGMKTMTCKQLGGACNKKFTAETFDEIAKMSKEHGMEMFQQNDVPHLQAMEAMQALMQTPEAMKAWMDDKKAKFDLL